MTVQTRSQTEIQAAAAAQAPPPDEATLIEKIEVILAATVAMDLGVRMVLRVLAPLRLDSRAVEAAYKIARQSSTGTGLIPALIRFRKRNPGSTLGRGIGQHEDLLDDPRTGLKVLSATRANRNAEVTYRAAYLINAARRIHRDLRAGKSLHGAMTRERVNWVRHLDARDKRAVAAGDVDAVGKAFGQVLGWYAVGDERTSAECRLADGHNFVVGSRPVIGYPGTVHPNCRCRPGAPFEGAKFVDQVFKGSIGVARPTLRRKSA